jgi:hypothetical protein
MEQLERELESVERVGVPEMVGTRAIAWKLRLDEQRH